MSVRVGVRREDKSVWERRVPVVPQDASRLQEQHDVEVWVQPSDVRAFDEEEYIRLGIRVEENLSPCPVIFGVKEIPEKHIHPDHTYVFFAHVIKGQPYNMPMLRDLMEKGCTLIDYEKVADDQGRRLIFFGRHAGLAGMIDTLWALGRRLEWQGVANPFTDLTQARFYTDLPAAKEAVAAVGRRIEEEGLPEPVTPFICGFAGYGNVFRGADEIFGLLPVEEIQPEQVADVARREDGPRNLVHKVVFKEEHTVEPISAEHRFELQDYYDHPEKYQPRFSTYLPYLNVVVNCTYWEAKYPRLVTKADLKALYAAEQSPRLQVIGDISCDIEGAIEGTVQCTEPGDPLFVYDPFEDHAVEGIEGRGPVIMAVDILPSELPRDASEYFSDVLAEYIPAIGRADYSLPFEELALPPEIKRAVIVHQGELTPDYRYIEGYLSAQ